MTIDPGIDDSEVQDHQTTPRPTVKRKAKERARRRCQDLARTKIVASQEEEDNDGLHPRWKPAKRGHSKLFEESASLFHSDNQPPIKDGTDSDFLPKIWNKPPRKAKVLIARGTPNERDEKERPMMLEQLKFEPFEEHQKKLKEWYKDG